MSVTHCEGDGSTSELRVYGMPVPKSGTRIVPTAAGPRGISTGGIGLAGWHQEVAGAAAVARASGHAYRHDGPVSLTAHFRFPMPPSRLVRQKKAGSMPMRVAPDLDKLLRAVCDALVAGGLLGNDATISELHAIKREYWEDWTGAEISLRDLWTP